MTYRIGHISDLHVWEYESPGITGFLNKRLIGGTNLLLNRSDAHSVEVVHKALHRFDELDVDHICITGDLTNLALPSEFAAALRLVEGIRDAQERVSVIPGNHDYYTVEAQNDGRFERYFANYIKSDLPRFQQPTGYPFVHFRGPAAVIGLNSGIATPPLMATGTVRKDELQAFSELLDAPELEGYFIIVMIHHPLTPNPHKKIQRTRCLTNADEVLDTARRGAVDLMIHGHNHQFSIQTLPQLGGTGVTHIVEAGSTSTVHHPIPEFAGTFNIFEIDQNGLSRIETHLFDGFDDGFVHWQEQVFERLVES